MPLDNPDLRFYIEELFRVRLLEPISAQNLSIRVNELKGQWLGTGISIDPETDRQIDLQAAITEIEARLLKFDTQPPSHQDWFALTPIWAKAIVHWHATKDRAIWQPRWNTLQQELDSIFQSWLQTNYDGLYNYPVGDSPVMLHHIPKFLARRRSTNPIALIVLDGMALDRWLVLLRDRNYDIYLTADHGNLEATGIGQPSERAFADVRGERVRIYSNTTLREATQARFPTAIGWTPKILPADSIPLFAPDRTAFVRSGEQLVCHGGISIEEVIVPFISIK